MPEPPGDPRIEEILARLERIERHLHLSPSEAAPGREPESEAATPPAEPRPVTPPIAPPAASGSHLQGMVEKRRTTKADEAAKAPKPPHPTPPHQTPRDRPSPRPSAAASSPGSVPAASAPASPRPAAPAAASSGKAPSSPRSIEMLLGGRVAAWIGALVVLVGVGVGVKYAWDVGWLGRMSPAARCWIAAVFGALLLGAGEVAYRRLGRAAAVGLFAAGLGTWYLTAYAALNLGLVGDAAGMGILALVALFGLAWTWRATSTAVGVVSLLGGYLTPAVLGLSVAPRPLVLPLYLTMLASVSLGLASLRPRAFGALRFVTLGGVLLLGLVWMLAAPAAWGAAVGFVVIWWGLFAAEGTLAAARERARVGNVVVAVLTTAAFVTAGAWVLNDRAPAGDVWLGAFTFAAACVSAALALHFGPGIDPLRRPPRTASETLALARWILAGVLLISAVAMQFDGYGQSISWLAIGLAGVEIGRRMRSVGVSTFGVVVGGMALARVALIDSFAGALDGTILQLGPVELTEWSILAVAAIGATTAAALRLDLIEPEPTRVLRVFVLFVASLGWLGWCEAAADGPSVTFGWLLAAALLLAMEKVGRRDHEAELALLVLAIAALRWATLDSIGPRLGLWEPVGAPAIERPFLNPSALLVVVLALLAWWSARLLTRRRPEPATEPWWFVDLRFQPILAAAGLLLATGVAMQTELAAALLDRASERELWPAPLHRGLWVTLATGVFAALLAGAATLARWRVVVATAGLLLGLATVIWLTWETLVWRFTHPAVEAGVVLNLQFMTGLVLAASIVLAWWGWPRALGRFGRAPDLDAFRALGVVLLAALGLWMGSLEIDRAIEGNASLEQATLSVYWGLYAAAAVTLGFLRPRAAARYAGLTLLAITVLKVLVFDLAGVEQIWRVISTVAVGLLLLATSIAYARVAPRLLGEREEDEPAPADREPAPDVPIERGEGTTRRGAQEETRGRAAGSFGRFKPPRGLEPLT